MNGAQNQATGHGLAGDFFGGSDSRANTQIAPRVDGAFTGTTHEILRWAACKWGIDEDIAYARPRSGCRWSPGGVPGELWHPPEPVPV
jgi:autotransporter family porin